MVPVSGVLPFRGVEVPMDNEPSSPVCYGAGADDIYMGYAGRDEIISALNSLIEAERAGMRVAIAWRKHLTGTAHKAFMRTLQTDEARWCTMLTDHVRRLEGNASAQTGSFFAKAIDIAHDVDRLRFLNKGQSWVVRALDALLPRVRNEQLHDDLKRMRDAHIVNIAAAEALIER